MRGFGEPSSCWGLRWMESIKSRGIGIGRVGGSIAMEWKAEEREMVFRVITNYEI